MQKRKASKPKAKRREREGGKERGERAKGGEREDIRATTTKKKGVVDNKHL